LFLQILMAVSFLIAGYQDFKDRAVSDIVWIPAIFGVVLAFFFTPSQDLFLLLRIGIIGAVAFGVTWYGLLGQADGIAFVLLVAQVSAMELFPLLVSIAGVALLAIGILYLTGRAGKDKTITIRQFKAEARWIPKTVIIGGEKKEVDKNVNISREEVEKVTDETAMVVVQYGVPNIEYIAAGYMVYLVYLAVFQTKFLLSLP
jgi:hypothetical protein